MADYFKALIKEVEAASEKYKDYVVKSVFLGGGTPSFPEAHYITEVMAELHSSFNISCDAEISMELNPGTASLEKLVTYRQAGINRLSIGTQSLDDVALKAIGRIHDARTFYETYENARKAGFTNINVDIMSALPGQSVDAYMETVEKVVKLRPEHISAYSLIIEEGTPFYDMDLDLPTEDQDREMYHRTRDYLAEHGYHRYEISNYALDGRESLAESLPGTGDADEYSPEFEKYECYHNKVYWTRGNYLGLGLGSSSMVENVRWKNTSDLKEYVDFSKDLKHEDYQKLSDSEIMEEFMFLGLRLVRGVDTGEFKALFNKDIMDVYGDVIGKYQDQGLLEFVEVGGNGHRYLRLTTRGLDVSNTVMADFLLN